MAALEHAWAKWTEHITIPSSHFRMTRSSSQVHQGVYDCEDDYEQERCEMIMNEDNEYDVSRRFSLDDPVENRFDFSHSSVEGMLCTTYICISHFSTV